MKKSIIENLQKKYADRTQFSPKEVIAAGTEAGFTPGEIYKDLNKFPKVKRGVYNLEGAFKNRKPTKTVVECKSFSLSACSISL